MEHTRAFLAYDTLCRIAAEIPEDGEQLLEQCEEVRSRLRAFQALPGHPARRGCAGL